MDVDTIPLPESLYLQEPPRTKWIISKMTLRW